MSIVHFHDILVVDFFTTAAEYRLPYYAVEFTSFLLVCYFFFFKISNWTCRFLVGYQWRQLPLVSLENRDVRFWILIWEKKQTNKKAFSFYWKMWAAIKIKALGFLIVTAPTAFIDINLSMVVIKMAIAVIFVVHQRNKKMQKSWSDRIQKNKINKKFLLRQINELFFIFPFLTDRTSCSTERDCRSRWSFFFDLERNRKLQYIEQSWNRHWTRFWLDVYLGV